MRPHQIIVANLPRYNLNLEPGNQIARQMKINGISTKRMDIRVRIEGLYL